MAFRLEPHKSLGRELKRAVCRQLQEAIESVSGQRSRPMKIRVHAARVACKKARAVLELLRRARPGRIARVNAAVRKAAHMLSPLRDADAIMDTFRLLLSQGGGDLSATQLTALRRAVKTAQRDCRPKRTEIHRQLARCLACLRAVSKRWRKVELAQLDIDDVLAGYSQTYRQSRQALHAAQKHGDAASFHEWRKQVKAYGYQSQLLCCAWPPLMKKLNKMLARLGGLLGEDHDLAVMDKRLVATRGAAADSEALPPVLHTLKIRRESLRAQALPLGDRLFAEKPAAVDRRMRRWWKVAERTDAEER